MEKRFKFKNLFVYSSDEWMANSTKRYRTVFDKAETTYLRFELALFNKLFDEGDWTAKVSVRCEEIVSTGNVTICTLDSELKVSKEDNGSFNLHQFNTRSILDSNGNECVYDDWYYESHGAVHGISFVFAKHTR